MINQMMAILLYKDTHEHNETHNLALVLDFNNS